MQPDDRIRELLKSWSNTRRFTRTGCEYPAKAPFSKSSNYRGYLLSEDDADLVDKAVLDLRRYDESLYTVLKSYYINGLSCSKQGRLIGRRTDFVVSLLGKAEIYVAAKTEQILR